MALSRILDFFSDPDLLLVDLLALSQVVFSKTMNLAFILVRYRFSITLWAARLAAFPDETDELVGSFVRRGTLRSDIDVLSS